MPRKSKIIIALVVSYMYLPGKIFTMHINFNKLCFHEENLMHVYSNRIRSHPL